MCTCNRDQGGNPTLTARRGDQDIGRVLAAVVVAETYVNNGGRDPTITLRLTESDGAETVYSGLCSSVVPSDASSNYGLALAG